MSYDEVPQDLHALNYSRRILDDLGLPAKGNLELVADCIDARAKQTRKPGWEAFKFIHRMAMIAQERGTKVDRWWFQNGDYLRIESREPAFKGTFEPIDKKRTAEEQATPEWQETNDKLRALLKDIATGKFPKKAKPVDKQKQELAEWIEKRKRNEPATQLTSGTSTIIPKKDQPL